MMSSQLLLGTALIITNAVFHVSCLVWLAGVLKRIGTSTAFSPNKRGMIFLLGVAVLGLIAIHTTSAWAWAGVYYTLGEFTDFSRALYFSVVTSTTLGTATSRSQVDGSYSRVSKQWEGSFSLAQAQRSYLPSLGVGSAICRNRKDRIDRPRSSPR